MASPHPRSQPAAAGATRQSVPVPGLYKARPAAPLQFAPTQQPALFMPDFAAPPMNSLGFNFTPLSGPQGHLMMMRQLLGLM